MTKPTTPTGWDAPWTYRSRAKRRWDITAAWVFSVTGVLGLPFVLPGLFFIWSLMVSGALGILVGLALLGFLAVGLRLLSFNVRYLLAQRRGEELSGARAHWTSVILYHVSLGLGAAICGIASVNPIFAFFTAFYAALTFVAFKARTRAQKHEPQPEVDEAVEALDSEPMTLPSQEEAQAQVAVEARVHTR